MILDIERLESFGKFVVHCKTEDQADELWGVIKSYFPDKLIGWDLEDTHWIWYKSETCYALHMDSRRPIQFSPIIYWMEHGYKIVPFDEVFTPTDLGEIQKDVCFDTNLLYKIGV
jgi:hypothetical protein